MVGVKAKYREFVASEKMVLKLDEQEHAAFLINIQKSILLSLEKRNLLTTSQCKDCLTILETQYSQNHKK